MKNEKSFDAVRCMREIRDALSREFQDMSFEEQRHYIRERVRMRNPGDASVQYAAQQSDAGDGGPSMLSEHSEGEARRPSAPEPKR